MKKQNSVLSIFLFLFSFLNNANAAAPGNIETITKYDETITKVLGPINQHLVVSLPNEVKFVNLDGSVIKSVVKMDPRFDRPTTPLTLRLGNYILIAAANEVSLYDDTGTELSSAEADRGTVQGCPILLKDGRILMMTNYRMNSSSIYLNFFKLDGTKLKKDGFYKVTDATAPFTYNENIVRESSSAFYFVDASQKLHEVTKKGKSKIISPTDQAINSSIAVTSNGTVVFTVAEEPSKIYYYQDQKIKSIDYKHPVPYSDRFLLRLANDTIAFQNEDKLSLYDSDLNLIKEIDLKPIKLSSMVIRMTNISEDLLSLVVFGFNVTEPNAGQGLLIFDRDLNLTHNLLDTAGGFTPLETGSLNHNVIYVGDNQGNLYRIKL